MAEEGLIGEKELLSLFDELARTEKTGKIKNIQGRFKDYQDRKGPKETWTKLERSIRALRKDSSAYITVDTLKDFLIDQYGCKFEEVQEKHDKEPDEGDRGRED